MLWFIGVSKILHHYRREGTWATWYIQGDASPISALWGHFPAAEKMRLLPLLRERTSVFVHAHESKGQILLFRLRDI